MTKKIKVSCPCCNNNLWDYSTYKLINICKVCGLGIAKKMPTEAELVKHYQKDYYFGDEYVDYTKDRRALEINFTKRVSLLLSLVKKKSKLQVLEIGSAYGFFLNAIKPYSKETLGFEMSQDGVNYANKNFNVNTTNKNFLKTKIKNQQDIVVMWDVIEHLRYPEKYIEKISKTLKKGGIVALTTGDIGAFIARKKGNGWRMIHPPTHLYYFTQKSLEILLEKNGLEPIEIQYPAHYRNLGSVVGMIRLDRERKKKNTKLIKIAEKTINKTGLHKINFGVNTRDIVLVVARKK